jgi:hypothetical protein
MAFSTGNQKFDFLLSRARNRKRSRQALEENNIDVETSLEKREEESESSDVTSIGTQVADMSGLGASGVSATGPSQSIADAQEMMDIAGVGKGQTAGQVAFDTEMDRAKADFAQSNPVGAAIAGFSTDAIAQGVMQTAPLGLAMAGQMGAAKTAANIAGVLSGPVFGAISGVIGPTAQDPYGQNVAMGSGLLGQVSQSLMSTHYSVADKVAQGTPGYAQGYYGGTTLSVTPGVFGLGLTYTGVNVPDIHQYSPSQFMADMEEAKAYSEAVEPFGGVGTTSIGGQGISVDTFSSPTEAAMNNTGYSSYGPTGVATGAAPPGSQFSSTGIFSLDNNNNDSDDNNDNNSSGGNAGDPGAGVDGPGGEDSSDSEMGGEEVAYGGRIGMQMGGDPSQQQAPSTEMGFIGGPPDQFTEQQTIADDIPKEVPEGTFVINAPAVEFAGKEDIKQMLIEAYEIVAQADTDAGTDRTAQAAKVPSKEQVEIMISRGEVVVPPEIAKVIGYDRLEKINNRGKKEVARRQEESEQQEKPQARQVAEGGFIDTDDKIASADYSEGGIDALRATLLRATGHLENVEQGLGEGFKYGKKSKEGDTLRHILTSGYISEDGFLNNFMSDLFDSREKSKNMSEEDKIDLNNNKFGRLLRQKYPDRLEFTKQARNVVDKLIKGETVEIDGVSPMMSVRAE